MKGIYGLGIAIALGLGGALFNFVYLDSRSRDVEKQNFIGIKPELTLKPGDLLKEEHLEPVGVPKRWVGSLPKYAIPYEARQTAIGTPVWRTLVGPTLLLSDDLKTPAPQDLSLGEDEQALGVAVDPRTYTLSLVMPGDLVSFMAPRPRVGVPTPAVPAETPGDGDSGDDNPPPKPVGAMEKVGPFKVLALGNRLGAPDVLMAAQRRAGQENVVTVAVKVVNGEMEKKAQRLIELSAFSPHGGLQILHNPKKRTTAEERGKK